MLVTTQKDWVRLPDDDPESAVTELKNRSRPFPIVVTFENAEKLTTLLNDAATRRSTL
jgi:tetraacyldisaccharide-1-P 4'-kinase